MPASRVTSAIVELILLGASALLALIAGELFCRFYFGMNPTGVIVQDVRSQFFQYDEILGWRPKPHSEGNFVGANTTFVRHNAAGFRDIDHQPGNKPTILVLGDSFVWGFDVEAHQRFTDVLQARHPEWSIVNLGVSGYGTDQELLLLQQEFDHYQPNLVLLIFVGRNDFDDNRSNVRHRVYFKPYFEMVDNELALRGTPVPRNFTYYASEHPNALTRLLSRSVVFHMILMQAIKRKRIRTEDVTLALLGAFKQFTDKRNVRLMIGLVDNTEAVMRFAQQHNIPYVPLKNEHEFPRAGRHWNAEGHDWVADRLEQALLQLDWVPGE